MKISESGFEFLEQLQKKNVEKSQRYNELRNYLEYKAREKGVPISGKFELTPLCNFNCKMCYVHLNPEQIRDQSILTISTWKELMLQAWNAGMMFATLTGGECLTYPGFEELFLYLHSLGCEVSVLTNGFLLNEKRIHFLKNHMPSMIQITLYGWNDDVYERVTGKRVFHTVKENIERAIEANLPVCISITPNKYLGEDLLETIRVAKELCKNVVMNSGFVTPREDTGRSKQQDDADTELYIRAYKYIAKLEGHETNEKNTEKLPPYGGPCHESSKCGLQCGGGRSGFAINWKGILKPCIDIELIRGYPLKDGFIEAWNMVNQESNNWPRVPECEGCAYNQVCDLCAANMLRYAEPGKMPIGHCEQTREFVRNGVRSIHECD